MRVHFDDLVRTSGDLNDASEVESFLYFSYWYAGLFVVIEGWWELNLHDAVVDRLLESPHVGLLRRYRNGVFHFQRDYFDKRLTGFLAAAPKTVPWMRELTLQFGRFFLEWYDDGAQRP